MIQSSKHHSAGIVHTLGKSETSTKNSTAPNFILRGIGTARYDNPALLERARAKILTQAVVTPMIEIARENRNLIMENRLWNTFDCQNVLKYANGRLYGTYCKNRICIICNRIRKAEMINKYFDLVKSWPDPHAVLLTAKSVKAYRLPARIKQFLKVFRTIKNRYKTRFARKTDIKLVGIRSLECCFNPQEHTYNPHFHLIVANAEIAVKLRRDWGIDLGSKEVQSGILMPYRIKDVDKEMMELLKYFAKFFTHPEGKRIRKGIKSQKMPKIYAAAMYNILCAMGSRHQVRPFGVDEPVSNPFSQPPLERELEDCEEFIHYPQQSDWINTRTGEGLTAFDPSVEFLDCIEQQIDIDLA